MLSEELVGQTLGHEHYRILRPLGYGGTSTVFLAQDNHLHRNVAIKVFQPGEGDRREFLRRFAREARVLAQLDHPNILPVYDYGETDGIAYLVMPYMSGGSLRDRIRSKGAMSPKEVVRLMSQVLNALEYAHERGLIHRDIKPGNMLFKADGTLMLSDFGLVKVTRQDTLPSLEDASTITAQAITGTPDYMAPEQIAGSVSPTSDIYAMGIVLYEMLVGKRPFKAENTVGTLMKHLYEQPRPLRNFKPSLSRALEAVVLKALEKEPEKRYQTPAELHNALEEALKAPSEPADAVEGSKTEALVDDSKTSTLVEDLDEGKTYPSDEDLIDALNEQSEDDLEEDLPTNPRMARVSVEEKKPIEREETPEIAQDMDDGMKSAGPQGVTDPPKGEDSPPDISSSEKEEKDAGEQRKGVEQIATIPAVATRIDQLILSAPPAVPEPVASEPEAAKEEATLEPIQKQAVSRAQLKSEEPLTLPTQIISQPRRANRSMMIGLSLFALVLVVVAGSLFAYRALDQHPKPPPVVIKPSPTVTATTNVTPTTAVTPTPIATPTATVGATSTQCPSPDPGRAAITAPLNLGKQANIIYFLNDGTSGTLKRYDISVKKAIIIAKIAGSIQEAQISYDGQWVYFVAIVEGRPQLRMVRMDGGGQQTLYCAPVGGTIYSIQTSYDQEHIVFNASGNTATAPTTWLLDTTSGGVVPAVVPAGNQNVRPITWLDSNNVYMMLEKHNVDAPLQNIYLYDIRMGTSQPIKALKKLVTSTTPCMSFDSSYNNDQLFVSTCTSSTNVHKGPSKITRQPSAGTGPTQIYTDNNLAITTLRTVSKTTLVFMVQNDSGDPSLNGLWKINSDGTNAVHLTNSVQNLCTFSQYVWSNFTPDGTWYALESQNQDNIFYGTLDGSKSDHFIPPAGVKMRLVGWTTM